MPKKESSVTGSFKCGKCGAPITFPESPTDDTVISCSNCGAEVGTFGEMKGLVVNEAKKIGKQSLDKFRKSIRKLKR